MTEPMIREPDLPDIEPPGLPEIHLDLPSIERATSPKQAAASKAKPQTVSAFIKSRGLAGDERMKSAAQEVASLTREAGGGEDDVASVLREWWAGGDLPATLAALEQRPGGLTADERAALEDELVDLMKSPMMNTKHEQRRRERRIELTRILGVNDED